MDYAKNSQSSQQPDAGQPFFTIGQGSNNPDKNNFEAENNLDLTNNSANWSNIPPTTSHDSRNLGNHAIFSSANVANRAEQSGFTDTGEYNSSPRLGEIVSTSELPLPPVAVASREASPVLNHSYNEIHTDGDHLSATGVKEVDSAISELNQTSNVANFYDEVRNMMEHNLENSFNRKVAA